MSVRFKIALLVAAPMLAVVLLVGFGWFSMGHMAGGSNALVEEEFMPLIEEDVKHLVEELSVSIQSILEADSAVHRAVIAEKMALTAVGEEEMSVAVQASPLSAAIHLQVSSRLVGRTRSVRIQVLRVTEPPCGGMT